MFDSLNIPSDITIVSVFLFIIFVISLLIYIKTKKIYQSFLVFSLLANLLMFLNVGMVEFSVYGFEWLQYLIIYIWPIINVILIIVYIYKVIRFK